MNYLEEKIKEKFEHNFLDGEPIENNNTKFSVQGVLDVLEFFLKDCQKRERERVVEMIKKKSACIWRNCNVPNDKKEVKGYYNQALSDVINEIKELK